MMDVRNLGLNLTLDSMAGTNESLKLSSWVLLQGKSHTYQLCLEYSVEVTSCIDGDYAKLWGFVGPIWRRQNLYLNNKLFTKIRMWRRGRRLYN
jgi:hypothetical protein